MADGCGAPYCMPFAYLGFQLQLQWTVLHRLDPLHADSIQLQVYTVHLPAVCSGASLVLCKLSGPAHKYSPFFQGYTSERHCIHFSRGPDGTEPPLPKAANSLAHLPVFLFFPLSFPLHSSSSASRNHLPNKVCGPKSLFWALIWGQLKLK